MKIAWLADYPTFYFADRLKLKKPVISHPVTWIVNLSNALAKYDDIELHIITLSSEVLNDQKFVFHDIHFHFLKVPGYIFRIGSLFYIDRRILHRELQKIKPDIVHAHGTEQGYAYGAVTSGFIEVITLQGIITELLKARKHRLDRKEFFWFIIQFIERWTVKRGKYFFVGTYWDKDFVQRVCWAPVFFQMWDAVNLCFFNVDWVPDKESQTIVFVGTIYSFKGVGELLMAFSMLHHEFPLLNLKLVGNVSSKYVQQTVKARISKLGLNDKVELCGTKSSKEIADILGSTHMLVAPGYMDKWPMVVCEAMVSGIPLIATKVGGTQWIIEHGKTGMLINSKNVTELSDAIRYLIEHPDIASRMGKAAKEIAGKRHYPDYVAAQVREAYRQILDERSL